MKKDRNGNLSVHIGAYHIRLHEQAQARARAMAKMRELGSDDAEIARAFNTTRQNVGRILKAYEWHKGEDLNRR